MDLDPLDAIISLAEASQLSGLAAHTLTVQAERGKLHARKVGHTWITTRHWLDEYLSLHARGRSPNGREAHQSSAGEPWKLV